jgi:hypothetical protein
VRHRLAESSENRHARSATMIDQLTDSPTADIPSPNPLDLLSLRQHVVFRARAHQRPLTELADLLG